MAKMEVRCRVLIMGSGPAGLTAAIYAARADLRPHVIEGMQPGGQLTITTDVENYPGFPAGIMGPELMRVFREQATRFDTQFLAGDVEQVELRQHPLRVETADHAVTCDALIIAAGARAKLLGLPSEAKLMGYGVSACATCDGFFFRNQEVLVIGGGDTAVEEALFLTKFASQVTVVHRRDVLRASKIMQDRALHHPKIKWIWNSAVKEIHGEPGQGGVTGVTINNVKTGAESLVPCQGVFVAIGHEPNTKLFVEQLEMDPVGYILVKGRTTNTSVPGVFAAGDAADPSYRQAVTAAGTGCMAAIDAERYLANYGHH